MTRISETPNLPITTRDGYQLAASEFTPADSNGIGIIVNGATGVRRAYYQAFARFLCEQGFTVLTYEFRGIGASRKQHVAYFDACICHDGA